MSVLSTVDDYVEVARIPDPVARRSAWVHQYEARHPDVFEVYYRGWGRREKSDEAAAEAPDLAAIIRIRERRARELIDAVAVDLVRFGLLSQSDLSVVLLVGGHTSNGWVATFRGHPTLFLALEFLGEPPFDDLLVRHEAIHLLHEQRRARPWSESVAAALFSEGLAVALCRWLRPGFSESAYLWFDDEHEPWVGDCWKARWQIRTNIAKQLDSTDADVVRDYFGAGTKSPLPVRSGYWLGDRWLRSLLEAGHLPDDLLRQDYSDIRALAREELL
jgi:hypothetical protein